MCDCMECEGEEQSGSVELRSCTLLSLKVDLKHRLHLHDHEFSNRFVLGLKNIPLFW